MSKAKSSRQSKILAELSTSPSLRIADLANLHKVSAETIRRDLDELTRKGYLSRTYGGAVKAAPSEPAVSERHRLFIDEREAIARKAVSQLAGAKNILIGSGSTTVHVARRIAIEMKDLRVITHSFGVATVLSFNPTIQVLLLPGDYQAGEGATVGAHAIAFLQGFNADYAIIGASGLSSEGPTEALLECSAVYSAMIARARRTLVVADHSKFDLQYPARYASWQQVDLLVTDQQPGGRLLESIGPQRICI
ncbi:DeoR/GlpR family DNA-binding transcription regulator [Stutzerimonas kirkiae]|uniref:DeoR/GlpR transcriptional regulator n=1 Tax=Stutzerimonas kirkiae TaxID=2211392 RepID=A0A4Q9R123_9GAMM|nr:DeoR/GlpR family DNA-binding transcription regulator [Stutzerimonas kirkiae]TBU92653.1 DeoR/GlpR transcriptional regulator [Stutzerimonas kirkiae]TBV00845.1 DeoR/GlpR transcriptional regulator [Stutzerimonas kirkiae]TBV08736.1 DeoR/GlpR transcriptional regulator [Stutzerimonas kirkiae]TBV11480.1 DeoR/GlpR transcriptional regulator [Stutzerimonas kirkiae]